jgi:mono/diheme cytochrome c family protein
LKKNNLIYLVAFFIFASNILFACLNKDFNQTKKLYLSNCGHCHGENGEGYKDIYPPLANADFIKKNPDYLACILRYGINNEIVVNGKTYNQPMLGLTHLSSVDITNLVNYMLNTLNDTKIFYTTNKIEAQLRDCRQTNYN